MLYSAMINVCSEIHVNTKIHSADYKFFLTLNLKVHKFTTGLERVKSECGKHVYIKD